MPLDFAKTGKSEPNDECFFLKIETKNRRRKLCVIKCNVKLFLHFTDLVDHGCRQGLVLARKLPSCLKN